MSISRTFYRACISLLGLSFTVACSTGYQVEKDKVFYVTWDEGQGKQERLLNTVDAATFRVIRKKQYAKDKHSVYFRYSKIDGADPGSFSLLAEMYSRDKHSVYLKGELIPHADPASFELISGSWARDASEVYLGTWSIEACDAASFTIISDNWAVDDKCAYASFNKLSGADPQTFSVLNKGYAKDKDQVYAAFVRKYDDEDIALLPTSVRAHVAGKSSPILYLADRIDGADPNTFAVDAEKGGDARDSSRCYRRGVVVDC